MSEDESLFANSESTEREELEQLVDPEPAPKKRRVGRPRKNASKGKTPANPRPQVPKTVSTRSSSSSKQSDQQGLVTPATTVPVSGSTETSAISSEQMSLLLTAINSSKKVVDRQIAEFRREIQKSNEEVSQKLSKKLKTGRSLDFKRKGNEKQYIFNEEVDDKLDTAESDLAKISLESLPKEAKSPYKRAKDALTEGRALIANRQKLILIADHSDHGWDVVKNYEVDELAEGSEDERKLHKAEKAAEKEAEKRATARKKNARGGKRPLPFRDYRSGGFGAPFTSWTDQRSSYPPFPPAPYGGGRNVKSVGPPVGPCHYCGELGHLRYSCPKLKPYPFSSAEVACVDESFCKVITDVASVICPMYNSSVNEHFMCEGYSPNLTPNVKGRLRSNLPYWQFVLNAPQPVFSIIKQGYILPFVSVPLNKCFKNHESAFTHSEFVSETVSDLLSNGCIRQVPTVPTVCSPLLVGNSGKKRLVINLRYVNLFLHKEKFKYEDMKTALLLLEKDDLICTFDLKSGYHHVDIHIESQQFLGFEWHHKFYVFTVLPFGLSTACYVFTKLLRPLVKLWRGNGIRCVLYIDDGLVMSKGADRSIHDSSFIRNSLDLAGFIVNSEKTHWEPKHNGKWLGFELDTVQGIVSIPTDKVAKLKQFLLQVESLNVCPAKMLASITGRIISMGLALGPISRLRTRAMYYLLNTRLSWSDNLIISDEVREEFLFWRNCIDSFNGQGLWRSPSAVRVVYSDASGTGYAGYTVEHGCHIAHGHWNEVEQGKSSTWRELAAVARTLESVSVLLCNNRVKWFTDNQNVVHIIKVGSKIPELQVLALSIFKTAFTNNICIEPEWLPREENQVADAFSRIIDVDDWMINPNVFAWVDSFWGPHTVDRFANCHNAQLGRFNSRFWAVGSEAVDAFIVNWAGENNWLCPPIHLVCRVLQHAKACNCSGTLIVPLWKSAPFWPMLCPDGQRFALFVKEFKELPNADNLILPGQLGSKLPLENSVLIALRVVFDPRNP